MRYLSVCSGIEAATVAWHHMGWTPVAFSDIEPFPSAVLAHHYPHVPNLGDMTKFEEWNLEPIDLLVGGTPCQSFSVAGLRKGLADPRGNLMLTYGAIAKQYRPKWLVWENVPGVLSSNEGRDFATFLGMLAELGYGFAYRILDAQYFGVAQRRRRVFVVGYLGDWRRAAAVLFERHSLCGHPAPSRETRENAAKCLTASLGMRLDPTSETFPIAPTLQAHDGAKWGSNQWVDKGKAIVQPVAETLIATDHKGPGHNRDHNFIAQPIAWDGEFNPSVNVAGTLLRGGQGGRQEGVALPMAFPWQSALDPIGDPKNLCGMLIKNQTMAVAQPVVHSVDMGGNKGLNGGGVLRQLSQPLGTNEPHAIQTAMQVRRLTPVECERLQGFPDNYTNIPWRKKPEAPDGPRYKALGNSMAVPVMRWIGERINKLEVSHPSNALPSVAVKRRSENESVCKF